MPPLRTERAYKQTKLCFFLIVYYQTCTKVRLFVGLEFLKPF